VIEQLARILRLFDCSEQPVFAFDEVHCWPAGLLDRLVDIGLLRETEPAELIACNNCDEGHVLEPEIREYPDLGAVAVAKCPTCGRVQFSLDRLKQWGGDFDGLALLLATELKSDASPMSIVPGRIALLGSIATPAGMLDVFFGRGLAWDDATTVLREAVRLATSNAPVILLPQDAPSASFWGQLRPHVVPFVELVRWNTKSSAPDFAAVAAAVHRFRPPVPDERWLTVTECAEQLLGVVSGIDIQKAKSRVSEAANRKKFRTNGETRIRRRIDRDSFNTWLNEQCKRDIAAADKWAEG